MATINDDPVTRFTTAQIVPTEADIQLGQFFGVPQLTQAQINEIPTENLVPGIIVFNTDYDCYMGYVVGSITEAPGRWCNFNASITYNGTGYEAGSPFALPLGARSLVETAANNMDPGVMYVDSENNELPRIYIPATGWQDVATSGTNPTFGNVTIDGTLTVTGNTTLNATTASIITAYGPTPIIVLGNGTVIGTGATYQVNGNQVAGNFSINTGSNITATGVIAQFGLAIESPNNPIVIVNGYPNPGTFIMSASNSHTLQLFVYDNPLEENTNYTFQYIIIGI